MEIHRTALWVLIGVCCAGGIARQLWVGLSRDYYARHASWRDAPGTFAGAVVNGVMVGAGFGLAAATGLFLAAGALARLGV